MNWDEYLIRLAYEVSRKSKDPSTQVGCILVGPDREILSTGFNGFPIGVAETVGDERVESHGVSGPRRYVHPTMSNPDELITSRWKRPDKYSFISHAERNAVYLAARTGTKLQGATAYLSWEPTPCDECAKALIQAGIKRIVGPNRPFPGNHNWQFDTARIMLQEAGVLLRVFGGPWSSDEPWLAKTSG